MKIKTLKKSHLKRNIIIGVVVVAIISTIILNFTKAKYRVTQSIPLVNGTINYSPGDIIISAYFNGELLDNFPSKTDGYVVESITCDKEASATFDEKTWEIEVKGFNVKGTECHFNFKEKPKLTIQDILNSKKLATRTDFSTIVKNDTTGTIYYADTNEGRTYYFAGNPTDNWVYFADFYWRIIRINENGSMRLIYNGENADEIGVSTQLAVKSRFNEHNSITGNNALVGYMYQDGYVHGNETDSDVKKVIDNWYLQNLIGYKDYIDESVGFCGDRTLYSGNGIGQSNTFYAGYNRLYTNKEPTFTCENEADLFTTNNSQNGNNALKYPIGLITADETSYAGGVRGIENNEYYLHTKQDYWTMTPSFFSASSGNFAITFSIKSDGSINANSSANNSLAIRPVINLKSTIILSGSGTSTDPYRIEGAE